MMCAGGSPLYIQSGVASTCTCRGILAPRSLGSRAAGQPATCGVTDMAGCWLHACTYISAANLIPDPDPNPCTQVEWWSMDTCRGSVVAAYINKSKYPVTWDQGGTFRLTKLGFRASDLAASSKQLCIELRQGSPCDTIDKFCNKRQCIYSLFDQSKSCCPTSAVPKA